jgi:hypothetical protein
MQRNIGAAAGTDGDVVPLKCEADPLYACNETILLAELNSYL